jgi:hypothetical protein
LDEVSPVLAEEQINSVEPPPGLLPVGSDHVQNTIRFFTEPRLRYRTVYKIGLPDRRRHHLAVSLDVQIPKRRQTPSGVPHPGKETYDYLLVPVAMVPIALLSEFDLRDEHGSSLPSVTREYEYALLYRVVEALWLIVVGIPLTAAESALLQKVLWYRGEVAQESFKKLDPISKLPKTEDGLAKALGHLIEDLRDFGVIFALLHDVQAGSRRIVKLSYSVSTAPVRQFRALSRIATSFGFRAYTLDLQANDFDMPNSVHYEIEAPPNLAFTRAEFVDRSSGKTVGGGGVIAGSNFAHLYSDRRSASSAPTIRLGLFPDRDGPFRTALRTSIWMTLACLSAALLLPIVQSRGHGSELGAGFLAAAVGLTAFFDGGARHQTTWQLFRMTRSLLIATTISLGLMGVAILGVDPVSQGNFGPSATSSLRSELCLDGSNDCSKLDLTEPFKHHCRGVIPPISGLRRCLAELAGDDAESLGTVGRYRWGIVGASFLATLLQLSQRLVWWKVRNKSRSLRRTQQIIEIVSRRINAMLSWASSRIGKKQILKDPISHVDE